MEGSSGKRVKHTASGNPYRSKLPPVRKPTGQKRPVESAPSETPDSSLDWFTNKEQREEFFQRFAHKEVTSPKVLDFDWLASNGFLFQGILEHQGLSVFSQLKGRFYPDLVRVFYSNLRIDPDGNLISSVKKKDIVLTDELFLSLGGLENSGIEVSLRALQQEGVEFNKVDFYKDMLTDTTDWEAQWEVRKAEKKKLVFNTGGLSVEDRLLHYSLVWIIAARGSNHAQISEDDFLLLCAMKNQIKVNWVQVVKDTMRKTRRLDDFKCPYAVFVSRIIDGAGIDTTSESREITRDVHLVKDRALKMMKLIKTDQGWISREAAAAPPPPVPASDSPAPPASEADEPKALTPFEQMILQKFGQLERKQDEGFREIRDALDSLNDRLDQLGVPHPEDD